jgi:arylsulfatase
MLARILIASIGLALPAGAPNVVVGLIDDAGFGNLATFGGPVATPALDRLAAQGLRYNRFHVTALCSPTRAALLSGRNHHSVSFGMVSEVHSGYPGYDAHWPQNAASLATILRDNGLPVSPGKVYYLRAPFPYPGAIDKVVFDLK